MRLTLCILALSTAAHAQVADWCGDALPLALDRVTVVTLDAGVLAADGGLTAFAFNDALLDAGACFTGIGHTATTAPGRDTAWRFDVPQSGVYSFRAGPATPTTTNTVLYLTDSCLPASSVYGPTECIAAANRTSLGLNTQEQLACVPLTGGQSVYLWVDDAATSSAGGSLSLEVTQCFGEEEPNDTPLQATALSCIRTGGIMAPDGGGGDVDFYELGTLPAGSRVFALVEAPATVSTDFDLRVTTATQVLEYDDSNAAAAFGELAPAVAGAPLPAEPTYLRVNYKTLATRADPYVLHTRIEVGAPTPEQEPNDTMAQATGGARYFSGTLPAVADVDFFSVTAQEGDVIFASLDAVPDRSDAGTTAGNLTFTLTLTDADGDTLLLVNDTNTTLSMTRSDAGLAVTVPTYPSESLVWRARATGTYGLRVAKTSGAVNTSYLLSVSTGCNPEPLTVTGYSPTTGTPAGGTELTLTGTGFSQGSDVYVGGQRAEKVSVSPTQLVVRVPAIDFGPASEPIMVTDSLGRPAWDDVFVYEDPAGQAPTVLSVTPDRVPLAGGQALVVTGSVFRPGAQLFIDGVLIPGAMVVSSTRILATAPAHAAGVVNVTVENTDALTHTLASALHYDAPPVITSVTPSSGLTTGAELITLAGQNFRDGTRLFVGAVEATSVTPAGNALSLTALTPFSSTAGAMDLLARDVHGQEGTLPGGYTYLFAPPALSTVAPVRGFASGNTLLTLTGTGLRAGAQVNFIVGGVSQPGTSVAVVGTQATGLTVRTPAHAPGQADVQVVNDDLQQVTLPSAYRFDGPPVIAGVSPSQGPTDGGVSVTLTGSEFRPDASVWFAGIAATQIVVAGDGLSIAAVAPGRTLNGPVPVRVRNTDTQESTLDAGFTYVYPAPTVAAVTPARGFQSGNTLITLTGASFFSTPQTSGPPTITVGGAEATDVTFVNQTTVRARTPAGTPGLADIVVTNRDGQSAALPQSFLYEASPTIAAVTPSVGPAQGGTRITITGSDFLNGANVTVGGVPAFAVSVQSATSLSATTSLMPAGAHDVIVINPDGQQGWLSGAFTAEEGPQLSSLTPLAGVTEGGTEVTLTGSGFATGAQVFFGVAAATEVTFVSSGALTARTPANATGLTDVTVRNPDGQSTTLQSAFRFVATPTLLSVEPSEGNVVGGEVIRLLGAGLGADSTVRFGDTAAPAVTYVNSGELHVIAPAHAPGVVDVTVTTRATDLVLTAGYTYSRGRPVVQQLTPSSGSTAGGTSVSISGSGFAAGATVTFAGQAAAQQTVVSGTLIRAVTPAHEAGTVAVTVTNPDGDHGTLATGFQYTTLPPTIDDTLRDGGSGAVGTPPTGETVQGGVGCGCTSFDGSLLSFALLALVARRRRATRA